jgi:hypothetical protein
LVAVTKIFQVSNLVPVLRPLHWYILNGAKAYSECICLLSLCCVVTLRAAPYSISTEFVLCCYTACCSLQHIYSVCVVLLHCVLLPTAYLLSFLSIHNDEPNDLYSSPTIVRVIKSRRMRWEGHVARMVEERGVYRVLVGKPVGKKPVGRPRRR